MCTGESRHGQFRNRKVNGSDNLADLMMKALGGVEIKKYTVKINLEGR